MSNTLKTHHPDVAFGGAKVGADEVDFFHVYNVFYPSVDATAIATAKGTPTSSYALAENTQGVLDYPRNVVVRINNTSGSTNGGTATINGLDQFGNVIQEVVAVTSAANGGTTEGTKVFSKFTSGTVKFIGAGNAANGCTCNVGYGTAGTTTLFGLPFKVGGTADLLSYAWASVSAAQMSKANALGSYVSTAQNAILARTDFGTASGFTAWLKSTKNQSEDVTPVMGR